MMKSRICNSCRWVFFGVTRAYAEDEVKSFNKYFDGLSKEDQENYYGGKGNSIITYEQCWCSNPCTNFSDAKPEDMPSGSTMNPIIVEET